MYDKKFAGRMKRGLAGVLAAGMILTGMPGIHVEAASEAPGQVQTGQESSMTENPPQNAVKEPGDTNPGEDQPGGGSDESDGINLGGEDDGSEENRPGDGTDEPGSRTPDGEENVSGDNQPGDGNGALDSTEPGDNDNGSSSETDKPGSTTPGENQPDDGDNGSGDGNIPGDGQDTETPQPGTEDKETNPEEDPAENGNSLNAVYSTQVSGNDISGNDLTTYEEETEEEGEGGRVVGGYIELPEDRDVSVVDESAPIYDYEDEIAPLMSDSLPSQYIPESGTLPLTRSQSPYGSCWAHSAMALAETDMMRNGGASSDADYSELHLAYFSYNGAVDDPLGGLDGDANYCTGDTFMDQGGNLALAQYVLANWVGAADESIAPYSQAADALTNGLSKEIAFTDVAHLQNAFQISLQENPDIAKRMIQKYGGVGTSYYDDSNKLNYYRADYKSYYCNAKSNTNHAVTIVGWDDSFSADNFNTKPEGDGAWLIRNSWQAGADTGSRGKNTYFWMSYYDKSLAAGYAFDFEGADNYHHNYQYDGSMVSSTWSAPTNSVYAANVFTAKAYEGGERLEAVGIAFVKAQTPYTVTIYKNLTDLTNPESGELMETISGTCGCEGFYTINLENSVTLAKGDTFSVVVRYNTPENESGIVYWPSERSANTWYKCDTSAQAGQSFYKLNSMWEDFGVKNNCNLRIKAYTMDDDGGTGLPTKIELKDELKAGIEVGVGDSYQASCTVLPRSASDRSVRWESDQPSVATVDENGLITGVADGTATITVSCTAAPEVTASFSVEVYSELRSIQIIGAASVTAGETTALETVRSPSSVDAADVQWSSSDERVLTVDTDGVVTGVAPGYASITAGIGEVTDTKEMTCEFPDISYTRSTSIEGITLTWPGGPSVKSYQIYRAEGASWTNPELLSTITETDKDTYSYLDEAVTGGNQYVYQIRATVNYIKGDGVEEKTVSSGLYKVTMPQYYSITYHLNGGENSSNNQASYRAGYSYNYIYSPKQRPGYNFTGWYYDEGLTELLGTNGYGYLPSDTTGNLDLYAGWTPIVYQITYQLNGGTNAANQVTSYTIETETFALLEATREGYVFGGWFTDDKFKNPITEIAKGSTGKKTLYAKWIENGKKITYELDGGTNAAENPSVYTSADGFVSLKDPTKKGYKFQGWYTESTYENRIYSLSSSSVKNDVTLYAKWELQSYSITYWNGGTHDNPTSYTIETPNIVLQDAVRSGYRFAGWYLDINHTNPITEIKADTCANLTIYAGWERIYSISYVLGDGGVNDPDNPTSYVESDEITLKPPVREGYIFAGWYTDAAYINPISEIKDNSGNLTLYAKWEKSSRKIFYELDGGVNSKNNPAEYTSATDFVLESPVKDGYDFQGWYTDSSFTNQITRISGSTVTGADMTLYAKWSIHDYRITYILYGGTNSAENPETYNVESGIIILKDAVREESTFEGWYSDFHYQQKVTQINSKDMCDITLYAKWQGEEAPVITAIQIKRPTRTTYKIGEAFDVSGGKVNCVSDRPMEPIPMSMDMISGFDSSKQGICSVTVRFEGQTADFETLIVEEPRLNAIYGQRLGELTLPENSYGSYSWMNAETVLNRAGVYNVPVFFVPNDAEAFQRLDDLYAQVTVADIPADKQLGDGELTMQSESFTYTGAEQEPAVTITVKDAVLEAGRDYTVTYQNNKDVGTATVVAEGNGDYYGSLSHSFTITPAEIQIRAKDKTISVGDKIPGPDDYRYEVRGLLMNDQLIKEPVLSCGVTEAGTQKAGQYAITPSAADAGPNYTITYEAGQLTVLGKQSEYKVTFDVQGHGSAPDAYFGVTAGSTIEAPEEPEEGGYVFKGWCKDAACTQDWDFEADIVQSDITLYAKWLKKSTQPGNQFQMQEIEDVYHYTGKAWKPSVSVYDGETMLKAGRDYTVKYFNNINVNAGGVWKKGSGQGADFNPDIPYVQITGKGNYTDEIKVNFDIKPAEIADEKGNPAEKVVLKYTDQFVAANKELKPFRSIKYNRAMKLNQDYTLRLMTEEVYDDSGKAVSKDIVLTNAAIPKGYVGRFTLIVTGIGNYHGDIEKTVYVADKTHLMKNAKITLGKNQKSVELVGESVELAPSMENSVDTFTVKIGTTILKPGDDYQVSYLNESNRRVGKATLVITGVRDYSGTKTAAFTVRGKAFTAGKITVTGVDDKIYTGKAITQNDARLVYGAGGPDEKALKYGTDYTVTYAKNINKGTATMTFIGSKEHGFSGSFKKSFKISAALITKENLAAGWDTIEAEYSKAGAKPVTEISLTNASGKKLQNGKDYTLSYKNNKLVASAADEKAPTIIVKGKGNYQGTISIPFTIKGADLRSRIENGEITVKTTAVAYQPKKPDDYVYQPAVKLMEGKTALRLGSDYKVTYIHNTQEDYNAYIAGEGKAGASVPAPQAIIEMGSDSTYLISGKPDATISVPLTIYRNKLTKANLRVEVKEAECVYTGTQVTPKVVVYYKGEDGEKLLTENKDYTVSYGANVKSGKKAGSLTISGKGTLYGGDVTVKFEISRKQIKY